MIEENKRKSVLQVVKRFYRCLNKASEIIHDNSRNIPSSCGYNPGLMTNTANSSNTANISVPNTTASSQKDNCNCPICKTIVTERSFCCKMCNTRVHQTCLYMEDNEFQLLSQPDAVWYCARYRQIKANKIKWGEHSGEEMIREMVLSAYADIIGWKKNIFRLPRGKCGGDFIVELTNLINHFVNKTPWQRLSLLLVHVFVPLMLQKPSSKSKPRDHTKYLTSRLERWKKGQLKSLMDEAREIQSRIKPGTGKAEAYSKAFVNLMLLGKF